MDGNETLLLGLGIQTPWQLVDQRLETDKSPYELHLEVKAGPFGVRVETPFSRKHQDKPLSHPPRKRFSRKSCPEWFLCGSVLPVSKITRSGLSAISTIAECTAHKCLRALFSPRNTPEKAL